MADVLQLFRTGLTLAGTGHRPHKLAVPGMDPYGPELHNLLTEFAIATLGEYKNATEVISGMALGWDMALAEACVFLDIPFIAAVPCRDQEKMWAEWAQKAYHDLLSKAGSVELVTDLPYNPFLMQRRNEWLVDRTDKLLALYDGSSGGTGNAVRYAQKKDVPVDNVWNNWLIFSGQETHTS